MTETPFIQTLKDAGICGAKIYPVEAKDNDGYPYCIYTVIRNKLSDELEGSKGWRNRYLFTSWHETYSDATATLNLFSSTILSDKSGRSVSGALIDKDPITEKWRLTNNDWEVIENH